MLLLRSVSERPVGTHGTARPRTPRHGRRDGRVQPVSELIKDDEDPALQKVEGLPAGGLEQGDARLDGQVKRRQHSRFVVVVVVLATARRRRLGRALLEEMHAQAQRGKVGREKQRRRQRPVEARRGERGQPAVGCRKVGAGQLAHLVGGTENAARFILKGLIDWIDHLFFFITMLSTSFLLHQTMIWKQITHLTHTTWWWWSGVRCHVRVHAGTPRTCNKSA